MLEVGRFGRPHGLRGVLRLFLHNPSSTLVDDMRALDIRSPDGAIEHLTIVSMKRSGDRRALLVQAAEIKDREEAGRRTGWLLMVPATDLPALDDDEFYFYEMAGAVVITASGARVGKVIKIHESGVANLVIDCDSGQELMVPIVREFVLSIERDTQTVTVVDDVISLFSVSD
jgi:16S rRNA processing protein RimM